MPELSSPAPRELFQQRIDDHTNNHSTTDIIPYESEHEGTPPTMPVSPPITMLVSPPAQQPRNFRWGPHEGDEFYSIISNIYEEVIHWRWNVFLVPSGSTGKAFVSELARLFQAYGDNSTLESITMKTITVLQALLLQKPSRRSKSINHVTYRDDSTSG